MRLSFARPILIATLFTAGLVHDTTAQSTQRCFRGRPAAECKSFWITESYVGMRFISAAQGSKSDSRWTYGGTVGWMKNTNANTAIGGTLEASDVGVTLAARWRRWVGPATSVDVSLGPRWEPGRIEVADLTVSLMYKDRIGATAAIAHDFGRSGTEARFALRTGSWIGVSTYAAALAGVLTWIALYDPD